MKFILLLVLTLSNVFAFDLRDLRRSTEVMTPGHISKKQNVGATHFPYQACISFQESSSMGSLCSGSLIGNEWILTAAHCAVNAISATVYLGVSSAKKTAEVVHTVTNDNIVIHSNWNYNTGNNDIALIKTPYTFYSAAIQPIKLPSAFSFQSNYAGDIAIATGWRHESNTFSSEKSKLKWTYLQVLSKKACVKSRGAFLTYNTICAAAQRGASVCSTDSGGPLVLEISKVQIGLKSLSAQTDCSEGYSTIFTRVSDHLDWIKSYTGIFY